MVKKIFVFIMVLGLVFIGIGQYNVSALIHNGVDYRVMETSTPIQINGYDYNPIVINEDNGGVIIATWLNYMQANNLHRIEIQAGEVSTFYIYYGNTVEVLAYNVFKIELGYDTGFAYFFIRLYSITQTILEEIVLANSDTQWELPNDTRFLTNINFQSNEYVYEQGYNFGYGVGYDDGIDNGYGDGYDVGYDNGYTDGYDIGYSTGLNETDATGFGALLTTVFSGLGGLLAIELLPNIHIGAIIAVPLVFGIVFFILGKRKGD